MKTAVFRLAPDQSPAAETLAADLGLPLIEVQSSTALGQEEDYDFLLGYLDSKLTLQSALGGGGGKICVDFSDAALSFRANSAIKSQGIAKAVGVKGNTRPAVLDATAGFGKDAFLLASMGCQVAMLERSPIVHALLADGLRRPDYYAQHTASVLQRMSLRLADFLALEPPSERFDVVYLDPMFPERRKSAKVKKEMALLQELLGHQMDGEALLDHARQFARKRVVVKRAKLSPTLGGAKPDIQFKGSSSRFDVYLVN